MKKNAVNLPVMCLQQIYNKCLHCLVLLPPSERLD